jgi:hypothetical protein
VSTTTSTDWYCKCRTFNKAAWSVCPVCETRREDLAGPSAAQVAEQRNEAAASLRRTTSSAYYGVVGAVIALAVLAGLALGGWKAWGYAQDRWFDEGDDRAVAAKPPTDQQLLAKHIIAPGAPFGSSPLPKGGRVDAMVNMTAADRKASGYQAGIAKMWIDPDADRVAMTMVMEFDSDRIPAKQVRKMADSFMEGRTTTFKTPLPGSVGLAGKTKTDGYYTTSVTIIRSTRVAVVAVGTRQPANAAVIAKVKDLAVKQYSHL